jgi:hypothetical protein
MSEENNNNNQPVQSPAPQTQPQPQPQTVPQKTNTDPVVLPQANDTGTFTKGAKPKK